MSWKALLSLLLLSLLAGTKAKRVWTPILSKGKPFPVKKMPVEVWAIGEFRFKGIPGVSKVNAALHRHGLQQASQTCDVMSWCLNAM